MKKILASLAAAFMIISLCACGAKSGSESDSSSSGSGLNELYDKGYSIESTSVGEESFGAVMSNEDRTSFYLITADMSSKLYSEYCEIDIFDEAQLDTLKAFINSLDNLVIESLDDRIPSQEDLDKYIGKKISDLEADGFEQGGYMCTEEECSFDYSGSLYDCRVYIDSEGKTLNMDDLSANDIKELKIKSVEFNGFSYMIFEQ